MQQLEKIIDEDKPVNNWFEIANAILPLNVNEKINDKIPSLLWAMISKFSTLIPQNKPFFDKLSESIKIKQKRYKCAIIISILIQKKADLRVCKNLMTSHLVKHLLKSFLESYTFEGFCKIFSSAYFYFGDITTASDNFYIYFLKNVNYVHNKKNGIYVNTAKNISVGPKVSVGFEYTGKEQFNKNGCYIIANILINNSIYNFKFVKPDKLNLIEGKKLVVIYPYKSKAKWTEILTLIESTLLENNIKPVKLTGGFPFSIKEKKPYFCWRNDYFKKELYNDDDFYQKVYYTYLKLYYNNNIKHIQKIYYNDVRKLLSSLINEINHNFMTIIDHLQCNLSLQTQKIMDDEQQSEIIKTIKKYLKLVTRRMQSNPLVKNNEESLLLFDIRQQILGTKEKITKDTLKNLIKEMHSNLLKLQQMVSQKIAKDLPLSYKFQQFTTFENYCNKNTDFMKTFVKYAAAVYKKTQPLYYMSSGLATAVAQVLSKSGKQSFFYNPFGFIELTNKPQKKQKSQKKQNYQQIKI
ncbi:MAG: hypothetical protein PVG30_03080 [Gammaproteobacteria bacterium]